MFSATTVLNQLTASNNGFGRLKLMIGAYNVAKSEEENFVSFKFKGCGKYNYCKIKLNAMDSYDLFIGKLNSLNKMIKTGETFSREETYDGVYCDQLKSIFEDTTKLYLSL